MQDKRQKCNHTFFNYGRSWARLEATAARILEECGTLPTDHLTRAQIREYLTKSVRAPVEGHDTYVSRRGGDWHTSQLIGRWVEASTALRRALIATASHV